MRDAAAEGRVREVEGMKLGEVEPQAARYPCRAPGEQAHDWKLSSELTQVARSV